ncbi:MAG TPA: hypothetical protein VIM73_04300, partial [Polyangiaceae bacterium]
PPLVQKPGRQDEERSAPFALALASCVAALAFFPAARRVRKHLSQVGLRAIDRALLVTAAAAALLVVTASQYTAEYRHRVIDDAYISFQYAKNWAVGNGPVFNPGERVEGFTNFLWVALMTPLWWIAPSPETFTKVVLCITVALAVIGLFLVARIGSALFDRREVPIALAVLLVAFDDSYVVYAILGLEKHLLVVGMLSGLWIGVRKPPHWEYWLGVSFALVGMTRPDGLAWMGSFFLAQATLRTGAVPSVERLGLASLLRVAMAFAGVFGAYYLARFAYYGYPLPNTFYLKVGSNFDGVSRGLDYLFGFVRDRYGMPLLALLSLWCVRAWWVRWLLLHALVHTGYVVFVGGDFYPGHRFLIALVPSLALLAAAGFHRVTAEFKGLRLVGASLAAASACLLLPLATLENGPYLHEIRTWAKVVDNNVRYMQWLGKVARPGSSIVLGDIGAAGVFANLRVLDVFGVVDPTVAHLDVPGFGKGKAGHEKLASSAALLAQKPTYIKWNYIPSEEVPRDEYYVFNDFPPHLRVEGLWVRNDLEEGETLEETRISMDATALGAWTASGSAFADVSAVGARGGQSVITGHRGALVNTFTAMEGDAATGRLLSPEFVLLGDRMRLLVGGGRDSSRLRISLIVDGRAVFSETGTNFETLGRREWPLDGLLGKKARLEIVDDAVGAWGHLLVDEIVQLRGRYLTSSTL